MHRVLRFLVIAGTAGLLAACSSSAHSGADGTLATVSAAGVPGSPSAGQSAGQSATPSAAAVSTAPAGVVALANVPAVTGGADLGRQPVVAAGATIPATLVVRDLVVGSGAAVGALATVDVKYVGTLFSTGAVFDASWGRATSAGASVATFALSGVIPGFADGIVGMKRGGRREIVVPPRLGYGANATGSISPNSTLVFIVDLVSFSG